MAVQDFRKYEVHGAYHWRKFYGPPWRVSPRVQSLYRVATRVLASQLRLKDAVGLDLGCGEGVMLRELSRRGATVIGLDGADSAVALAKRLNSGNGKVRGVLRGDAQAIPIQSGCLDFVTCLEVIEHVEKPEALVGEVRRVLKDGGVFVASTPHGGARLPLHDPYHVREYSRNELSALLGECFHDVKVYAMHHAFTDRIYHGMTGIRPLDRAARAGLKVCALLWNPFCCLRKSGIGQSWKTLLAVGSK